MVCLVQEARHQLLRTMFHHGVVTPQHLMVVLDTAWFLKVHGNADLLEHRVVQRVNDWVKYGGRCGCCDQMKHGRKAEGDFQART